jgi:outer membrane protein OmpA-like peptidoglycan-associated protein
MKFIPLATSLFALALFAAPVFADDAPVATDQPAVEQPSAPAAEAAPQIPQEVLDFIADARPLSELSPDELATRAKLARQYSKLDGLPPDVRDQLKGISQSAKAEIANRDAAAAQAKQPAAEAPAPVPAPVVEQPVPTAPAAAQPAEAPAPAAAEIPQEVLALINDGRPASELSVEELNTRAKQARKFAKMDSLPQEIRDQLAGLAEAAHAEFVTRQEKAAQAKQPTGATPPAVATQPAAGQPAVAATPAAPAAEVPADVASLLADVRPLSELTVEELTARLKLARQMSKSDQLADDAKAQLAEIAKASRAELMARDQQATQKAPAAPVVDANVPPPPPAVIEVAPTAPLPPPPAAVVEVPATPAPPPAAAPVVIDKSQAQTLDGNVGTPEAEAKAKKFLEDPRPAEKLGDEELRNRLDGIRELMAGNELSRDTERALRQKLKAERDILRNRVAVAETAPPVAQPGSPPPPPASTARPPRTNKNEINLSFEVVLNDRRPSDELQDYELRRRLEVYRQATYDQRYQEQQRAYWRAVMDRDQYLLQQRLLHERHQRQAELRAQYEAGEDAIQLDDSRYQQDNGQEDVYAAEVDDTELQDVLIAPPRKKISRRYTVQEVEASPDLRAAMPRIEIDTVHFGFNEAFVRAEEVSNLDRLAEIMERILTAHPREIFLIEGHTDAVGSDAANLVLSRQRAEAIKTALQTYYVIPGKNLRTVGYGERYLKIPTAEAEQENRRVSVSRATALIGQADE